MKNLFKFSLITAIGLLLYSCDEDKTTYTPLDFPSQNYVAFDGESATFSESFKDSIPVKVLFAHGEATSDMKVGYKITTDNATEGVHYEIIDNKSSYDFPSGTYSDEIFIKPIDNLDEDGPKTLTFTLTDASVNIGAPGPDSLGKTFVLTLSDNDCAFNPEDMKGIVSGTETTFGYDSLVGEAPSKAKFSVIEDENKKVTFEITDILAPQFAAWGETVTLGGTFTITIDYTDPSTPIIEYVDNGDPLNNGLDYFYAQADDEWGYYLNPVKSSLSTCDRTFYIEFLIDVAQASTNQVYEGDFKTKLNLEF